MDRSRIALVIPALNEAASIGSVVQGARQFGVVIVVDDGSSDATGAVAGSAGADVVRHPVNSGYDSALNSGFARAAQLKCEIFITMDADGQHDPSRIGRFIAEIEKGADVVIGVRDRRQRIAEDVYACVARRFWGIEDPLCGMKAYRIEVYKALGHFDAYGSIGTELAIFAAVRGYRVSQLPIETGTRIGAPRFGRRFLGNWRIFRALLLTSIIHRK